MADLRKSVKENAEGEFFVDSTCIDCDTCRQIAPETFGEARDHSFVRAQPTHEIATRLALRALLSCPTGSIGTIQKLDTKAVRNDFPLLIAKNVYYCGFNSPKSFGGNSYFVQHKDGNWLIDSPKFLPHLVDKFKAMGGIRTIFLTHRDDVADADKYAQTFSCERIIHAAELDAQPKAERVIARGLESLELSPGFVAIPTPGHTEGHMVLLINNKFLFTGDHLWWDPAEKRLGASRNSCWYSWEEQIRSMERLKEFTFTHILCGHGQRIELSEAQMKIEMVQLIERMKDRSKGR